ncbi:hypothetical protein N0V94_001533 [Neodidymelliopsis sp. IMI 364377]|nr:hypothetical protein N0V94_001533 [Neodidymelliopsis sp. IMI 364377]
MARLTATLLFAALASAEYTTTVWMTRIANSDKYGYVASVIGADAQHMTLSLKYDSNTNKTALQVGDYDAIHTFGPSMFELRQNLTNLVSTASGVVDIAFQCTRPANADDEVPCTQINGDGYARFANCGQINTRPLPDNFTSSYTHEYGTGIWGSAGTETITMTINYPSSRLTTTPAWCTSDDVPDEAMAFPTMVSANQFAVYQVVVTAGEEKLSAYSPTAAQSTAAGSTPTASAISTAAVATSTGAAGKVNAMVPALAGMGIAAVMGML